MEFDFDLDAFLERPLFAHLATASPDGPRESPVWFVWEDGSVWLIGNQGDSFPKRIREDERCAIGIVDFDLRTGFLQHVGMRGVAEVLPIDKGRFYRLLRRYLGDDEATWEPTFRTQVIDVLDLMVRFTPTSIVVRDQSYFSTASPRRYPGPKP
jgi:pyridoxamine 5'-phosphate oxidase-like protein